MKTCDICRNEISDWHSYEVTGTQTVHMACALGHAPARVPGHRWEGDRNLMPSHVKDTSTDGRLSNVPPHLRESDE